MQKVMRVTNSASRSHTDLDCVCVTVWNITCQDQRLNVSDTQYQKHVWIATRLLHVKKPVNETCCIFLYICQYSAKCVSQQETHLTISPIAVKVFSAFKPEVQKLLSHHPQLITFALSFYPSLSLFLLHAQLVQNNMSQHQPKLNWAEMNWTILKETHYACCCRWLFGHT